jgi:hypothetical protein
VVRSGDVLSLEITDDGVGGADPAWHNTRSGVIVTPRCHFVAGNCSFDFHAVVPSGKRALISTGSGNVMLANLSGPVIAATGSGNIRAENVPDAVSMETGSGTSPVPPCPGRRSSSRPAPATSPSRA